MAIITVAGDAMLGASGLSKQIEYLKEEPDNPLNWLQYYECYVTNKKMRTGLGWTRLIINPVGFAVSQGMPTVIKVVYANMSDEENQALLQQDRDGLEKLELAVSIIFIKYYFFSII